MLKKCLLVLGFEQCLADSCVFRLIRGGIVVLILVVHVDDICAVGKKERCDQFGKDLNRMVPVKNLGELKWYSGFYERDREAGRLKISQQTRTEGLGEKLDVKRGGSIPLPTTCKLYEYDVDEPTIGRVFLELIGSLLWNALLSRPDIVNAVRAVARYCSAPKMGHWKAALGILGYAVRTSSSWITFLGGQ